ncbi:SfsA [Desulforapulum autotrophicum HRM2]|uniref:Sugar fermentation stimulation protein homolog n=1 Tax=Desulforapulum autotrophicum (strain ATCC 43914 / DSM 3382 / VKM B-1955 / HRM2) TaxID=177437 RepID=C0QCA5_DESAH|nr:DNA/RNA nuclease SfsA [Desulforapulum autotrophicum]ACN17122.1 SfsA [Desulforapulum autotrophicum HRM2]
MTYHGYELPQLIAGTLVRRYKRFLADVTLETGELVTAHCPNTGSMRGCCEPGKKVYLSESNNPKRKLGYTWELMELPETLIGINTQIPNKLVHHSIGAGLVDELTGYTTIRPEVKTGDHTRLDLLLTRDNGDECFVEVKNCTLVENGLARFPDAVTLRGQKHLAELQRLAQEGKRAVIFYLIQRMDAVSFSPAADIDPMYACALKQAVDAGVEVIARDTVLDTTRISMGRSIPVVLEPVSGLVG